MLGLRQKISLGFGGLLIIILFIGIQSIIQLSRLGDSIDVILRENYPECHRLSGDERSPGAY